jgi:hypothetical protein
MRHPDRPSTIYRRQLIMSQAWVIEMTMGVDER